jgi:hypothetical protein
LVPRDEVLPASDLDRRVGGQVGDVDRDEVGSVSGRFLGHSRPGLPDPTDVGPRIYLANFEIMRFPRHPFYRIVRAKVLQSCGASPLGQGGSSHSNVRRMMTGCKDLGKSVGANKYLASLGKSSGRCSSRGNRRCIRGTSLVTSGSGGNPLGLGSGLFVGGSQLSFSVLFSLATEGSN